jgi:hypothetical protein
MRQNFLVGFFLVDGQTVNVEVPCPAPGKAAEGYAALEKAARKLYPKAKKVARVGSIIESREAGDSGNIELTEGITVRQLFPREGAEPVLKVGQVFFQGASCELVLRFSRSQDKAMLTLRDRLKGTPIHFVGQSILGGYLAEELPKLIATVLGAGARDMRLRLVKA